MRKIYWDTMIFAYWLEDHPQYADRIEQIYRTLRREGDQILTSVFTSGELLVAPIRDANQPLISTVNDLMSNGLVEVLPITANTMLQYGHVRAQAKVSPADAIHLASAAEALVDLFLTNDRRLRGLSVPGIKFIAGLDTDVI